MIGLRLRSLFFNVGWYVGTTILAIAGSPILLMPRRFVVAWSLLLVGLFSPFALGMYWKRTNQWGAVAGTVGGFVAFITAMLMIIAPLRHLSDVVAPITRGLAAVERGLDLMEQTPRESGGTHDFDH